MAEVWCEDYKNKVPHPTHWHVIRVGGITYAQGQCPGYQDETIEFPDPLHHPVGVTPKREGDEMNQVWKYSFNMLIMQTELTIRLPSNNKLIYVHEQGKHTLAMWFEVMAESHTGVERTFVLVGTGQASITENMTYVGTGMFDNGALVLHVYEVKMGKTDESF